MNRLALALVSAALLAALPASARADTAPIRRFALVIGANDGGTGRVPLRFANSDAEAFAHVLTQLGGVGSRDAILLTQPTRAQLLDGIIRLQNAIAVAKPQAGRVEALIYYSGHSDENGILIGNERVTYPELRAAINRLPSDVRIAILDSCSSGALIREKGGKHLPPFLIDDSSAVHGHAFLTATSADEAAQESDRIGGSFFTAALVTGLRGAADATRDGRVTLNEAYAYAFNETLARTEKSRSGPQHPAYDIQLVGTGDLVMTDLRATSAGLVLADELEGRIYLRDARGRLIAELRKTGGAPIELGLEPGTYGVTVESNGAFSKAEVTLADGKRMELRRSFLQATTGERFAVRGNEVPSTDELLVPPPPPPPAELRVVPFNFTLLPGMSLAGPDTNIVQRFAVNVLMSRVARLDGIELGLGINSEYERMNGAQLSVVANWVDGEVSGAQLTSGINFGHTGNAAQFSSVSNWMKGSMSGAQATSAFNYVGGALTGAQFAGGFNIARAGLTGMQGAGGFNVLKGGGRYAQFAGGFNVATGEATGMQAAGGFNIAGDLRGAQFAGGFNLAHDVKAQFGTVNIAKSVSGLQLGVINIAEKSDWPIGLINVVTDGYLRFTTWADDLGTANFGLKMGGKYLYTLFAVGAPQSAVLAATPSASGEPTARRPSLTSTVGLGVHIPAAKHVFVDIETTGTNFYRAEVADHEALASLRAVVGLEFWRFGVWAGPTLNALVDWTPKDGTLEIGSSREIGSYKDSKVNLRVYPGFVVGLQI